MFFSMCKFSVLWLSCFSLRFESNVNWSSVINICLLGKLHENSAVFPLLIVFTLYFPFLKVCILAKQLRSLLFYGVIQEIWITFFWTILRFGLKITVLFKVWCNFRAAFHTPVTVLFNCLVFLWSLKGSRFKMCFSSSHFQKHQRTRRATALCFTSVPFASTVAHIEIVTCPFCIHIKMPHHINILWTMKLPFTHRFSGRQQMAETNCRCPGAAPIISPIIEKQEHATPKSRDLSELLCLSISPWCSCLLKCITIDRN